MLLGDKDHRIGKQMRPRANDLVVTKPSPARRAPSLPAAPTQAQPLLSETAAAVGIRPRQFVRQELARVDGDVFYQAAACGTKKAITSASSRVRLIGGRLRQTRLAVGLD